MIQKINNLINKKAMLIFTIFLFMQPILDSMIGIFNSYSIVSSIISAFKILFLCFCLYYICLIKKNDLKYILILFLYCIGFLVTNVLFKGSSNIFIELKILIKNIFFPISLIFVINLFKENKFDIKNLYRILIIYIVLIFVPNILNLGLNSYSYAKLGNVGFFYSANAIGSIISMLTPLLIGYLFTNKSKIKLLIFLGVYLYILATIGTKAPILCFAIIVFYYFILYILNSIKEKKYYKIIIILLVITSIILLAIKFIPITPFYKNLVIHLEFLNVKSFSDLFTFNNFDHFIFSARLTCFKDALNVFNNSSIIQKLFGIGYVIEGILFKTSEMDYLVTFIHQGVIGFVVLYWLYFKLLFKIFKNYFKKFKAEYKNIKQTSIITSIIISMLCAFLAGHVLETPSVCIFVSTLIAIAYKELKVKE